jgi:hypothetical protein
MNNVDRKAVLLIWLTLAGASLNAQTLRTAGSAPSTKISNAARLSTFLRQPLPGHALAQGNSSTYDADSLYQYIDGGADIYLLYDFKTLLHQNVKSDANEVTADIYEMGNREDAFGIYSSERSSSYTFLPIGAEGYRGQGILNFLEGQYYVKLSGSGPNVDGLLGEFAQLLSSRIGGSRTLPALLASFPREHRIAHSEQFIKKDPLGHAFLAPAYLATYEEGKQQMKLIVSVANSAPDAKARTEQLARHFKQTGREVSAPELGENGMRASNSFEGQVIARTHGRYLIALFNPGQRGAQILKNTAQRLP